MGAALQRAVPVSLRDWISWKMHRKGYKWNEKDRPSVPKKTVPPFHTSVPQVFFRLCALSSFPCSRVFGLVQLVHSEEHCAEHNINALQNNMILRIDFTNILLVDMQPASLKILSCRKGLEKSLESIGLFGMVG